MITVKDLVSGHANLWQEYTPWIRNYVKQINEAGKRTRWDSLNEADDSVDRSINNQAAFIKFSRMSRGEAISVNESVKLAKLALLHLPRNNVADYKLRKSYRDVIVSMSDRLVEFTFTSKCTVSPSFTGIGVLGECCGDILVDKTLYEVKAGARDISVNDIKQLIIYATLNQNGRSSKDIKNVGVINPRMGYYWYSNWAKLITMVSDSPEEQVVDGIVKYMVQLGEESNQ